MRLKFESMRLQITYIDQEDGKEEEITAGVDCDGSWNQWGNTSEILSQNVELLDGIALKVSEITYQEESHDE